MSLLQRYVPALDWLPRYDRRALPVQYGLYAVPLALLAYALFGSSQRLFVGPSATVATISGATVAAVASGGGADRVVILTAVLTLMVAAIYVLLGLARMGFVARFFAKPVLDGFIIGLGLFMIVGQLPTLVGIEKPAGDTIAVLVRTLSHVGDWELTTGAVGGVAVGALFALARFVPKIPGALVVVVASILVTRVAGLTEHGVAVVGDVPTGFHFTAWSGVSWNEVYDLVPGALAIVIVGFAQSIAIAKALAAKARVPVDANQELIAYGAANLGAGALQGFSVTGSLSKSAAAEQAGGRTPVLLVVSGALVALTVLVLAGLFKNLPEPVLAAIVINAVAGMVDVSKLRRLARVARGELVLALGALLGVVVMGILPGVLTGVALSFVLLIHRLGHPHVGILGRTPDGSHFADLESHPDHAPLAGVLIHRFEAPLIFANAEIFSADIRDRVAHADDPPSVVILDLEAVADIDSTGSQALRAVVDELREDGVVVRLARANSGVRTLVGRDREVHAQPVDEVFATVHGAADAPAPPDPERVP